MKHQHTLLSDISAVGSLDSLRGVVVIAYGVYTTHAASPLCDGVNLNDRGKRQHVNVYASVSNSIIVF